MGSPFNIDTERLKIAFNTYAAMFHETVQNKARQDYPAAWRALLNHLTTEAAHYDGPDMLTALAQIIRVGCGESLENGSDKTKEFIKSFEFIVPVVPIPGFPETTPQEAAAILEAFIEGYCSTLDDAKDLAALLSDSVNLPICDADEQISGALSHTDFGRG